MSANLRAQRCQTAAVVAIAVAVVVSATGSAICDDTPSAAEAIQKARALERQGHPEEAEFYLRDLIEAEEQLARDATVLLELARLTDASEEALALIDRAITRTRDSRLICRARSLKGDYLYAQGQYVPASREYQEAAGHGSGPEVEVALLKRGQSLLAAGDASAATEAFRELAEKGGVPGAMTPWAELWLGRALLLKGDPTGAALQFERTGETYPEHDVRPHALAGAAESHRLAGNEQAARSALEALILQYPGTFEAVLAREDIQTLAPADTLTAPAEEESAGEAGAAGE